MMLATAQANHPIEYSSGTGQPGQHRAQRLRHRCRPDRSRLRDQAERRPPQPLPDPGAPAAAGGCQPGTCHRRSPRRPGRPPAILIGPVLHTPHACRTLAICVRMAGVMTDMSRAPRPPASPATPRPSTARAASRCCAADALRRRPLGVGGIRDRRAHTGWDPLPAPGGCSPAGCPASPSLLHLSPGTAVRWVHQAGGDWSRNAAELARERVHRT